MTHRAFWLLTLFFSLSIPVLGDFIENDRSPLAPMRGAGASDDIVKLYHQGNLRGGKVSSTRGLSTSPTSELGHYRPGGKLYEFEVPRSTYNQWLDDGLAIPKTDLHAPSGIVTPEIRIPPPASGDLNKLLVAPGG